MPRPLSDSWQYFEVLGKTQGKSPKARCKFCGHEQSAGITRLHQHLLERCSRISADIRGQLKQRQEERERDSTALDSNVLANQDSPHIHSQQNQNSANCNFESSLQNTLNNNSTNTQQSSPLNNTCISAQPSFYEAALSPTESTNFATANPLTLQPSPNTMLTNTLGQQQQQQQGKSQAMLDYHLARALFSADIPLQKIENPLMMDFLKLLQPNYIVPNAKTLQQVLLKEQHWDLIQCDTQSNSSPPIAPPPSPLTNSTAAIFQQQRRVMRFANTGNNKSNGNTNNTSHIMSNRLLNSFHPPTDLEGSL